MLWSGSPAEMPKVGEFLVRTLAALVALVPAAIGWWRGRALVRLIDDPALPERLVASRRQATSIAVVADTIDPSSND